MSSENTYDIAEKSLNFSAAVPRELVHRAAISEVFVTDMAVLESGEMLKISAQLPRYHAFHSDLREAPEIHDPLLIMEICRQACFVVAHLHFDVPTDKKFILRLASMLVLEPSCLVLTGQPPCVTLTCRITRRWERAGQTTGMEYHYAVSIDDRPAAEVEMSMQWLDRDAWTLLRRRARERARLPSAPSPPEVGAKIHPARVGRQKSYNVVIGPLCTTSGGGYSAPMVVDVTHPTLFDHPQDHFPGMLQLEAWRQLAAATALERHALAPDRSLIRSVRAEFLQFAELELPAEAEITVGEPRMDAMGIVLPFLCMIRQSGQKVATGSAELCYASSATPAGMSRETSAGD